MAPLHCISIRQQTTVESENSACVVAQRSTAELEILKRMKISGKNKLLGLPILPTVPGNINTCGRRAKFASDAR
jgi:hypothetical protein